MWILELGLKNSMLDINCWFFLIIIASPAIYGCGNLDIKCLSAYELFGPGRAIGGKIPGGNVLEPINDPTPDGFLFTMINCL